MVLVEFGDRPLVFGIGNDRLDDASNGLTVNVHDGTGGDFKCDLVRFLIDRDNGPVHTEVGHDLRADDHRGLKGLLVSLALAAIAEHEKYEQRQNGEHDKSQRVHETVKPFDYGSDERNISVWIVTNQLEL